MNFGDLANVVIFTLVKKILVHSYIGDFEAGDFTLVIFNLVVFSGTRGT
jgi:hypothetical protein